MSRETPYSVLGLDQTCDEASLLAMYRHLVKTHHPDRGGDAEKFRTIQEAYEQINTPEKRRKWAEANNYRRTANQTRTSTTGSTIRTGPSWEERTGRSGRRTMNFDMDAKHYYSYRPKPWTTARKPPQAPPTGGEKSGDERAREGGNKVVQKSSLGFRRWMKILTAATIASTIVSYAAQRGGGTIMDSIENGSLAATLTIPWSYASAGLTIIYGIIRAYIAPRSRWRSWRGGVCVGVACAVLANSGANAYFYMIGSIVAGIFLYLMSKSGWGRKRISGVL